jgi:uncharacterized membrane protein
MHQFFFTHPLRKPLVALIAASMLATLLLAVRIVLTQRIAHLYLVWNVFLAWIPLLLALRLEAMEANVQKRQWRFWGTAAAWLLFLPNAPYIFTDLKHLKPFIQSRWWTDLILILLFAIIGLVLAFLSLYRVQQMVARSKGWVMGWAFVCLVAFLCGYGVYLGRFERWNTWDVLINPFSLLVDSVNSIHGRSVKFSILFGTFLFTAYGLLYSLTSLSPVVPSRDNCRPR